MKKKTKSIPGKKRAAKTLATLDDLLPDDRNANRGTERGSTLIRRSLKDYGAGRSVLADKDGRLIAGNKTVENARAMGMDKIRVVQTDGSEIVVVQRTDLTLNDRKARELALVDNRAGQVSLEWDVPAVESIAADFGIELGEVGFVEGELDGFHEPDGDEWGAAMDNVPTGDGSGFQQMTFTLTDAQVEQVKQCLEAAKRAGEFVRTGNENSNGNALARICEAYSGKR